MVWEERRQEMMSQVLYWREARLCQPRKRKREKKKKNLFVTSHYSSSYPIGSYFYFLVKSTRSYGYTKCQIFNLSSETKVKP